MARVEAFLSGLVFGAIAGVTLGVLSAPKPGRELRREVVRTSDNFYRRAIYKLEELTEKLEHYRQHLEQQVALRRQVHDFAPRVNAAVDRAHTVLENTRQTTAASRDLLLNTQQDPTTVQPKPLS
jgi:gas vesicle protein